MHKKMRRIIPLVLIAGLSALAWWYFTQQGDTATGKVLRASGSIEAAQITVSPELSGIIQEVLVQEGQKVEAGDLLVRFDTELLNTQLQQAQAEGELLQAEQALDALKDNASLAAAQALHAPAEADKALDQAGDRLEVVSGAADQAAVQAAQAEPNPEILAVAQAQVKAARAAVDILQTQLAKLSISAPQDGVVLTRSAEPGENVLPGTPC